LPFTEAKRSGQAERSGEGGSWVTPDYDNPTRTHAEEGRAELSRQAERSGEICSGVSLDCDTTQHADAQTKAICSGQAKRSEEVGSEVPPDYDNPTRTHAE
jgi:hypothetical protein